MAVHRPLCVHKRTVPWGPGPLPVQVRGLGWGAGMGSYGTEAVRWLAGIRPTLGQLCASLEIFQ